MTDPATVPAEAFLADCEQCEVRPHGSGHIHETFCVEGVLDGVPRRFLMQRFNTAVFGDPAGVASNIARVTDHLARKSSGRAEADARRRSLQVVPTLSGRPYHRDASGALWRMFHFIDATRSHDAVASPRMAEAAGKAFGAFAADLDDLAAGSLRVTIPDFHGLAARSSRLEFAADRDPHARAGAASPELARARELVETLSGLEDSPNADHLPVRVVHNDCKLNNLLFDIATDQPVCVIDLDTVMPGAIFYDFGELVRSAVSRAPEDTLDLTAIEIELDSFEALTRGYLAGARTLLDDREIRSLALAGPTLALENAVRFLHDHLVGDRYFKISRPDHNLERARAQLTLTERLLALGDELRRIVASAR